MPRKKRTLIALVLLALVIGGLLFLMLSPIPAPQKAMEQELDRKEFSE
jgi:hypothetical protein